MRLQKHLQRVEDLHADVVRVKRGYEQHVGTTHKVLWLEPTELDVVVAVLELVKLGGDEAKAAVHEDAVAAGILGAELELAGEALAARAGVDEVLFGANSGCHLVFVLERNSGKKKRDESGS